MPNIYQGTLARLQFKQESSYGTDMTSTIASNWDDIPAIFDTLAGVRNEEIVEPAHLKQRLDQRDIGVPMPKDATFSYKTNIEVPTARAGNGVAAAPHWLGRKLQCGLGGSHFSTGTTVTSGATTTVVPLTSASTFRAGCGIAFATGTGGAIEIRVIKSISGNTVTLKMALSSAPANGSVAYGTATYYPHNNPAGADPTYAQFALWGYNPKDRWVFPGGAFNGLGFEGLEPKGIPRLLWDWQHPIWGPGDGTYCSANMRTATFDRVAYVDTNLFTVRGADYRLRDLTSSALPSLLNAPKVDIIPNTLEYEALMTPSGGSGLCALSNCFGYRRIDPDPQKGAVTVNLDVHWENDTVLDDYHANRTALGFTDQVGSSPTLGCWMIEVPRLQMKKPPAETKLGNMRGKSLVLDSLHDTEAVSAGASANDNALAEASWRLIMM
jgi:hypothetical protein